MRHSLEARTPFLDYRVAEFAAKLPVEFKINIKTGEEKYICRHTFYDKGIIDRQTAFRSKQPFTIPMAEWLSEPDDLPDCFKEVLLGDMLKKHGILNPDILKRASKKISVDGIGPATLVSAADKVFAICIFTLWYNEFF